MIRNQIYLTERQVKIIKREAKDSGISMAELIRRILDKYLDKE